MGSPNGRRPDLYHGNKEPASLGAALGALTHTVELLTLNDEGVSRLIVILCVTPIKLRGDGWLHLELDLQFAKPERRMLSHALLPEQYCR